MERIADRILWEVDVPLLISLNTGLVSFVLDWVMLILSDKITWFFVLLAVMLWHIWRQRWEQLKVFGLIFLAVIIADAFAYQVLKPFFDRLRPCKEYYFVRTVLSCGGNHSFPSNHATNFMLLCVLVMKYCQVKWGVLAFILTIGVGMSRVYLGVHYPTDILAGFVVGGIFGMLSSLIYDVYLGRYLFSGRASKGGG